MPDLLHAPRMGGSGSAAVDLAAPSHAFTGFRKFRDVAFEAQAYGPQRSALSALAADGKPLVVVVPGDGGAFHCQVTKRA